MDTSTTTQVVLLWHFWQKLSTRYSSQIRSNFCTNIDKFACV